MALDVGQRQLENLAFRIFYPSVMDPGEGLESVTATWGAKGIEIFGHGIADARDEDGQRRRWVWVKGPSAVEGSLALLRQLGVATKSVSITLDQCSIVADNCHRENVYTASSCDGNSAVDRLWSDGRYRESQLYLAPGHDGIGLDELRQWDGGRGKAVTIACLDTGFNVEHPALGRSRLRWLDPQNPLKSHPHGTRTLGVLCSSGAIEGVVPDAEIVLAPVDCFAGIDEVLTTLRKGEALPAGSVVIINLELQFFEPTKACISPRLPVEVLREVRTEIALLSKVPVYVVMAAGNGNSQMEVDGWLLPGQGTDAIVVGACCSTDIGARHPSSNFGSRIDVNFWGDSITTIDGTGGYYRYGETSAATSVVGGVVASVSSAWLAQHSQALTAAELRWVLCGSGRTSNGLGVPLDGSQLVKRLRVLSTNRGGIPQ